MGGVDMDGEEDEEEDEETWLVSSHSGEKTRWAHAHLAVLLAPTGHAFGFLRVVTYSSRGLDVLTGFRRRLEGGGPEVVQELTRIDMRCDALTLGD
jgi:hypothetical protein